MFPKKAMMLLMLLPALLINAAIAGNTPIKIGYTPWSDAEFVTKLAKRVLEEKMDKSVKLQQLNLAFVFKGVAEGDLDVMLMAWLPAVHREYMSEVRDEVVNLGIIYAPGKTGWGIPDYVPKEELNSIEDLKNPEVREQLNGTIYCSGAGTGDSLDSAKTLKAYGLDGYTINHSSGAGQVAALARAERNNEWLVLCAYNPHWMFGKWDLRYLKDPKGTKTTVSRIHKLARKGFFPDHLEAAQMISRMQLSVDTVQNYLYKTRNSSVDEAVAEYMKDNPKRIEYWVSGNID